MRTVFADTGYWIALLDPQDTLHPKAIALTLALAKARICMSEMVLTEFSIILPNEVNSFGRQQRL